MNSPLATRAIASEFGRLLLLGCLLLGGLAATSCRSTKFPDHPQEHRLAVELRQAPHPYYRLLANGVFSRTVGLQPPEEAKRMLAEIKTDHWAALATMDAAPAITTYLRGHGLNAVADAIQAAMDALANQQPSPLDGKLEAAAVKQGLIQAYYGLFPPT